MPDCPHSPQICNEFERFAEFMPAVKVANFFGGIDIKKNRDVLKNERPSIVVGTPGRIKQVRQQRKHSLPITTALS